MGKDDSCLQAVALGDWRASSCSSTDAGASMFCVTILAGGEKAFGEAVLEGGWIGFGEAVLKGRSKVGEITLEGTWFTGETIFGLVRMPLLCSEEAGCQEPFSGSWKKGSWENICVMFRRAVLKSKSELEAAATFWGEVLGGVGVVEEAGFVDARVRFFFVAAFLTCFAFCAACSATDCMVTAAVFTADFAVAAAVADGGSEARALRGAAGDAAFVVAADVVGFLFSSVVKSFEVVPDDFEAVPADALDFPALSNGLVGVTFVGGLGGMVWAS